MTLFFGEFQGYEFGRGLAGVGDAVGVAAGEPFDLARHEVTGHGPRHWAGAFDVAANVEVCDGD